MTYKRPRLRTILSSGLLFFIDERTFMCLLVYEKQVVFNYAVLFLPFLRMDPALSEPYPRQGP
jgi:hypothetical protein